MKISQLSASLLEKSIFSDVSLTINPGELHIIQGKNGSGKSSLAMTLMGHPAYTITQGTVTIDGDDITYLSPDKRAHKGLYLAMQYPPVLSGISVLTFLHEASRALSLNFGTLVEFSHLVKEALEVVGLDASFMQRAVHDGFSGGEKKRLELAQILVLKPRIIILDEIDSGLDSSGITCVQAILARIRTEQPQIRILCITHNLTLAQALEPDFVHTMQDGKLG